MKLQQKIIPVALRILLGFILFCDLYDKKQENKKSDQIRADTVWRASFNFLFLSGPAILGCVI